MENMSVLFGIMIMKDYEKQLNSNILFDLINVTRCPRHGFYISFTVCIWYFVIRSLKRIEFSFHIDLIAFNFCVTLLSAVQFVAKCFYWLIYCLAIQPSNVLKRINESDFESLYKYFFYEKSIKKLDTSE